MLSHLRLRWTDPGSHMCWFRRNEAGGNILQHFAPPACRPTLWDGGLSETDQLARRRVGPGENSKNTEDKNKNTETLCVCSYCGWMKRILLVITLSIFLQCTRSCGSGSRDRRVICSDRQRNLYPVDQCNAHPKPSTVERCNTQPCYTPQGEHMHNELLNKASYYIIIITKYNTCPLQLYL